jgi:aminopeptidase N
VHQEVWLRLHAASATDAADLSPAAKGWRKLRGAALVHLMAQDAARFAPLAFDQYQTAGGMTDRISALATLAHYDVPQRAAAFADFHVRYRDNALVLDKWFQLQAFAMRPDVVDQVKILAASPDFTLSNPNRVRALYGAFSANQAAFHDAGGAGYALMADLIITLDATNAQTAARMVPPFGRWQRFDEGRAAMMRAALERIVATPGLSRDVFEQASKSLAG